MTDAPIIPTFPTQPPNTASQPTVPIPKPHATPFAPQTPFVPQTPTAPPAPPAPPSLLALPTLPPLPDVPPAATTSTNPTPPVGSGSSSHPGNSTQQQKSGFELKALLPALLLLLVTIGSGVAMMLYKNRQVGQTQAPVQTKLKHVHFGTVQQHSCSQVVGYVCDASDFSQTLQVALYYDRVDQENLISTQDASLNQAEASIDCGGTTSHGFSIEIPPDRIPAGNRRLIVRALPSGSIETTKPTKVTDFPPDDFNTMSFDVSCEEPPMTTPQPETVTESAQTSISCSSNIFRDELTNVPGQYNFMQRQHDFEVGEIVVNRVILHNDSPTAQSFTVPINFIDNSLGILEYMDTSCGRPNPTSVSTGELTVVTDPVESGQSLECGIRMRVRPTNNTSEVIVDTKAAVNSGADNTSCSAPIKIVTNPTTRP